MCAALFHFFSRLGAMHRYRRLIFMCQSSHFFHQFPARRILCMKSDPVTDLSLFICIKPQIIFLHLRNGSAEIIDTVTEYITETAVFCRARAVVHIKIHIVCRRDPACQIFHDSKLCKPIDRFSVQLCFRRKHLFVQPVIQLHVVCMGS